MADTTQIEIADGRIIDAPKRAVDLYNDGDTAALTAFVTQYYIDNPTPSSSTAPSSPARDVSVLDRVGEGVSAFNRNMLGLADVLTSPVQLAERQVRPYAQAMMGHRDMPASPQSAFRDNPQAGGFFSSLATEKGALAGDDFWGNVAAGMGDMTAYAIPTGTGFRLTAKALTEIPTFNPSTLRSFLMEMGRVTPRTDIQTGLVSGAGGSVLGQAAEDTNIPFTQQPLEPLARVTGEIISPVGWSAAARTLLSVGRNYIIAGAKAGSLLPNKAIPSLNELRGLKNAQYSILEEAAPFDGFSVAALKDDLLTFANKENIDPSTGTGFLDTKIRQLIQAADEGRVSYSFLDDVISTLKAEGAAGGGEGFKANQLAQILDDRLLAAIAPSKNPAVGSVNVGEVLTQARALNRRLSNATVIENIFKNAETNMLRTGKNSSAEYNKYIRDHLEELLLTPNAEGYNRAATFFTKADKRAVKQALERDNFEEFLNLIQRAGFSSDDYVRIQFLGTVGGLGTAVVTGGLAPLPAAGLGAIIMSNTALAKLAEVQAAKLMRFNATLAKQMIAAGDNGADIIRAYYRNTPVGKRKPEELSALLINNRANLDEIRRGTNFARIPLVNNSLALSVAAQEIIGKEQAEAETQRLREQNLIPPD